jgi:hypothetical protein
MGEGGERKKKSPEKMAFRGFLFQARRGLKRFRYPQSAGSLVKEAYS